MNFNKKASLAFAPIKACSCVIFVIYFMTGMYWMYDENRQYHKKIDEVTSTYYKDARQKIQTESNILLEDIKNKERDAQILINERLREKVATAYTLTSHFYGLQKYIKKDLAQETIIEYLRPLRWNNDAGFYFIFDENSQTYILNSQYPECEILSANNAKNQEHTGQKIKEILYSKEAGFYRGYLNKEEILQEENLYFIKKFLPFNWVIGGAISYKDIRLQVQHSILLKMQKFRFGEGGSFLCFDSGGKTLVDTDEYFVGRNIKDLVGMKGQPHIEKIVYSIVNDTKATFFQYDSLEKGETISRIAYVQKYEPWNWTIVSSVTLENLDEIVSLEKNRFIESLKQGAYIYLFIVLLTLIMVFLIAHYYSLEISKSLALFSRFFSNTDSKIITVNKDNIIYKEFVQLSEDITSLVRQRDKHISELTYKNDILITHQKLTTDPFVSLEHISSLVLDQLLLLHKSESGYIVFYDSEVGIFQMLSSSFSYSKGSEQDIKVIRQLCSQIEMPKNERGLFPNEITVKHSLISCFQISEFQYLIAHCCNSMSYDSQKSEEQMLIILEMMWLASEKQKQHNKGIEQQHILETIIESLPTKIIVVDDLKNILFMSKAAKRVFGVDISQKINRENFGHLPLLDEIEKPITEVLTDKKYLSVQCVGENDDNEFYSYLVHISPVFVSGINGVCLRVEDSTARAQLDKTLAESEKMLSVAGIVTGIAYELDKPLASLNKRVDSIESILNSEVTQTKEIQILCNENCKGKPHILETLGRIKDDSAKANKLLSEMLSFSQRDELAHLRSYADIAEVVNISLELALVKNGLELNRDLRQITIKSEYKNIEMLSCHQENLQQVFVNIISNALYAISEKYADLTSGQITLRIYQDMRWVTIEIENNGKGVEEREKKRIFEPFYTTKKNGRGLGLSVASFIVTDQHEGELGFYNTGKNGTCFQVQLPVKRAV